MVFNITEWFWHIYLQLYSCIKDINPENGRIIGRNMLVKILQSEYNIHLMCICRLLIHFIHLINSRNMEHIKIIEWNGLSQIHFIVCSVSVWVISFNMSFQEMTYSVVFRKVNQSALFYLIFLASVLLLTHVETELK